MPPDPSHESLRPRDLALLLLASPDLRPRQRARDQQADLAGLNLMRRLLEQLAALDPEPETLEAVLLRLATEMGGPSGPARAVATQIRDEWRMACASPEWVAYLLTQATEERRAARGEGKG